MNAMEGVGSRLLWFFVLAVAVSYASYLVLGAMLEAQSSGQNEPVYVRDELQANQHDLSGMVMVPTPCDELSVQTEALSPTSFALLFSTWREPSVTCGTDSTPRAFQTTLFAPAAGVTFTATLDSKDIPIVVVPIVVGSH